MSDNLTPSRTKDIKLQKENLKQSKYNHFIEIEDGKRLVFSAASCGMGIMDQQTYEKLVSMGNGRSAEKAGGSDELLANFLRGKLLVPDKLDEVSSLRFGHFYSRFGIKGFGLTVIPTYNCNFACDYCYESHDLHAMPVHQGSVMSDEVQNNLIKLCEKNIAENSNFTVNWYGGEPLMGKAVIDSLSKKLIELCEAKKTKYSAGMITNGYLLNKENLEFVIRNRISFLQITLDGPRDIHDQRRPLRSGGKTYDTILTNITNIPEDYLGNVSIRINIDKRNAANIEELFKDLKSRGLHTRRNITFNFGHTVQYTSSCGCSGVASSCMATEEFAEFSVGAYKSAIDMGFKLAIFPSVSMNSCGAIGLGGALVEPNGDVQQCWVTVGNKDRKVGELTSEGITYNENRMKWLGWVPFKSDCEACEILPICMGSCPYKSIYPEDSMGTSVCPSWKYNLKPMLEVARYAQQKGLLMHSRASKPQSPEET